MPDWVHYVRQHLTLPECPPEREASVVEELAAQFTDAYQDALRLGLSEEDAKLEAERQVSEWPTLANELIQAGINERPKIYRSTKDEDALTRPREPTISNRLHHIQPLESTASMSKLGGATTMEIFWQDVRYAARMLMKKPMLTLVAIATLAIGIGVNTAIFSVIDAVLIQALPYPESSRLAVVWSAFGKEGRAPSSGPELVSLRERSRLFDQFGGIWVQRGALTGNGEPEQINLGWVTANFLSLLSARAQVGRFFVERDQGHGAAPVAVLSHSLWERRYRADPNIVGRRILLSGESCTVVGVLPAEFKLIFPEGASVPPDIDVYVPFQWDLARQSRDQGYIRIIGRLRRGVTLQEGQAELDRIAEELRSQYLEYSSQNLHLEALSLQGDVARNARPALLALFAGTGLVLLIACANVAMLLLSRASERRTEMTVRAALGAEPARIICQLLTESVLLSCLGGIAGFVLCSQILKVLWLLEPDGIARSAPTGISLGVLAFNFGTSLLCGILFGLSPAFEATRLAIASTLRQTSRTLSGDKNFSRQLLIGCEVAMTFVLLTSSSLLIATLSHLLQVNPGFKSDHVLTFEVSLPDVRYQTPTSAVKFVREARRRLSTLPTVESVGVISHLPFDDSLPNWYDYYWRQGAPKQEQNTLMADHRSVLPSLFDSLGAKFIAGRNFDTSDEVANRKVAIIDDSLAKHLWPAGNAIGQNLNIENGDFVRDIAQVVGVVKHLQYHSLTNEVRPQVYLPYAMAVRANMFFTVRSKSSPERLVALIRHEIANLDKDLPIADVKPLNEYVSTARRQTRFITNLCGALGAIALLLSGIGIYGLTSSAVKNQTKDIGIRMALGAQRRDIVAKILRNSMFPVICGGLVGLALSIGLMPLLSSLLYDVQAVNPVLLISVLAFVCLLGLLACAIPAQRVLSGSPVAALRCE